MFYKDGLLSENLEAYNRDQIAGYRIKDQKIVSIATTELTTQSGSLK
jgi:hypothetical protein